jgi:methionyl-tRNA formyltransferase
MEPDSLDSGPILTQAFYAINENTRIGDVYAYLRDAVPQLFLQAVEGLQNGRLQPRLQSANPAEALRCYPRQQSDGLIDWRLPAGDIIRLVNASSEPFAGAYTYFNMKKLTVWRAYAQPFETPSLYMPGQVVCISKDTGYAGAAAADGVVMLQEVQAEGGERTVPAGEIKSLRARLGMCVEDELYRLHKIISKGYTVGL